MKNPEQAIEIVHQLRCCGRYLHHHWGCGKASQARALRILADSGEMTQRQLQDEMGIQQGSLSELVKKLEDQALIVRTCAPEDRRQLLIRITEAGQAQNRAHRQRRQEESLDLLAPLNEEERRQLGGLLTKLLDSWTARQEEEKK